MTAGAGGITTMLVLAAVASAGAIFAWAVIGRRPHPTTSMSPKPPRSEALQGEYLGHTGSQRAQF